jgi:hypothetical protein
VHVRHGIVLDHLDRMTDSTGLIQHAIYNVPRRESGYTTDDNARALRLCTRLWCREPEERMLSRVTEYLSFLEYARRPGGGFHNFLSYQRSWFEGESSGDCQGQAVRALAEVLGSALPDDYRTLAGELIEAVLPVLADLRSLRAQAYVILAWGHLWAAGVKNVERLESVAWSAAVRLVECYHRSLRADWQWFESGLTYANAVLPHALFVAARRWPKDAFLEVAEESFAFLDRATTAEIRSQEPGARSQESGDRSQESEVKRTCALTPDSCALTPVFWPVGNRGWYPHGEDKAPYDQQPIEAAMMADAAVAAFALQGDAKHLATFRRAHGWFHGQNSLRHPPSDARRGACCDGLQPCGLNRNQGAESTLAYLWAEVHNFEVQHAIDDSREVASASA